ncbi:hypothetical protein H8E52_07240 [bacterium]|nr:hypothetical protein [bacterium]
MTTRARLTTLLILAVALLASSGCLFSTPEKPGGGDDGPTYLDYTTPDNLMANFVEAWNHMDFAEYRDQILYDGEEMASDGGTYEAFKFYFIEDTGEGPSWGIEEEKAHTQALFSGNPSQDGATPGVESIDLRFNPASVWSVPDNPFEVQGDTFPVGTQFRSYLTDMTINLKGTIEGSEVNVLLVRDTVRFYTIPVDGDNYRLWKWIDISQGE